MYAYIPGAFIGAHKFCHNLLIYNSKCEKNKKQREKLYRKL